MAVADNAGVESLEIGMGVNMGVGVGHHPVPVTRTYSLPSVDASDSSVKQLFDPSRLEQQPQHQQLHVLQQQTPDTVQQIQQSKQSRSGPRPPPKHTPSRSNVVISRDPEAVDGVTAVDSRSNVSNDSLRELEDLLTKLNPLAQEFVPPSHIDTSSIVLPTSSSKGNVRRQKNGYSNLGKRRATSRTNRAQREDSIRRTVYVSDIDQQVTEEQLAALFIACGQVVDCRVCGDPNSVLRFAFVEFTDEDGARAALSLAGTMLGYYPVRVLPSKTAIVPVNPTFLPRSEDEREMCARTIYCTNIDKKVSQADVKLFFESLCGEVSRLRLLGDYHHSTRIAFVEFVMLFSIAYTKVRMGKIDYDRIKSTMPEALLETLCVKNCKQIKAESAMAALNCSGAILGSLPIRVSPSKTPVRPRSPRAPLH